MPPLHLSHPLPLSPSTPQLQSGLWHPGLGHKVLFLHNTFSHLASPCPACSLCLQAHLPPLPMATHLQAPWQGFIWLLPPPGWPGVKVSPVHEHPAEQEPLSGPGCGSQLYGTASAGLELVEASESSLGAAGMQQWQAEL